MRTTQGGIVISRTSSAAVAPRPLFSATSGKGPEAVFGEIVIDLLQSVSEEISTLT